MATVDGQQARPRGRRPGAVKPRAVVETHGSTCIKASAFAIPCLEHFVFAKGMQHSPTDRLSGPGLVYGLVL